jgi:hypothetical protein
LELLNLCDLTFKAIRRNSKGGLLKNAAFVHNTIDQEASGIDVVGFFFD